MSSDGKHQNGQLNERLATSGLRFTPQRERVYTVLCRELDHPTAEEVFIRAKEAMPEISFATVYNCLDALVKCGMVRQVNLDRAATRFCPNMQEHSHFYCEVCGGVFDVNGSFKEQAREFGIPSGFKVNQCEVSFRGICSDCLTGNIATQ